MRINPQALLAFRGRAALSARFFSQGIQHTPNYLAKASAVEELNTVEGGVFKEEFFDKKPLTVVSGLNWPAMKKWSFDHIERSFPNQPVNLFRFDLSNFYARTKVEGATLQSAIDLMKKNRSPETKYYIVRQSIPGCFPEGLSDIHFPSWHRLPSDRYDVNLWMGEAGNKTPIHYDATQNFLVQLQGEKEVILFPRNSPAITRSSPFSGNRFNFSPIQHVDIDTPASRRALESDHYESVRCILRPGMLLYIPPGWWHQVNTNSLSVSVNYFWTERLKPYESCREAILDYQATSVYNREHPLEVALLVNNCTYDNCLETAQQLNEVGFCLLATQICGVFVEGFIDALANRFIAEEMLLELECSDLLCRLLDSDLHFNLLEEELNLCLQVLSSYQTNKALHKNEIFNLIASLSSCFESMQLLMQPVDENSNISTPGL